MLRHDGFDTQLEDQDAFIQPTPATEIALGELVVQPDYGVVTDNEFGRIEIGDERMDDLGGYAPAEGRSEIGDDDVGATRRRQVARQEKIGRGYSGYAPAEGRSEIGEDELGGYGLAARDGRSEIGEDELGEDDLGGYAPAEGRSEIGDDDVGAAHRRQVARQEKIGRGYSGYAPAEGRSEIGGYAPAEGRSEIGEDELGGYGLAARDGRSEIGFDELGGYGLAARDGRSEIGFDELGEDELGYGYAPAEGRSELLGALVEVVKKARDNRAPPPPMAAVDIDSPFPDTSWDESLVEFIGEVAVATGNPNAFSRTLEFMQRAGSGIEPRVVRIDTEADYNRMRQERSPELTELKQQFADLSRQVAAHAADPYAHGAAAEPDDLSMDDALTEDIQDLVLLGEAAKEKEMEKRLDFWMPAHFDGYATAWREDDFVGASVALPSPDGRARIATSLEELDKCVGEMTGHAADVGLDAPELIRYIAGMGCVMGAGTVMKEIAAATPAIAQRPEMESGKSFVIRIEPKVNPALSALAMLAMACRAGDKKACEEWAAFGAVSPPQIKQAMVEAFALAKAATR